MDQIRDLKQEEPLQKPKALLDDSVPLVTQILTELLPYIASHGGHVELVRIQDFVVFIRFSGACVECPLSFYTVTYGIERHIKAKLPWITRVEVVEN